jgi:hypothetical protein
MISAFELQDQRSAGVSTCEPEGRENDLGGAVVEAHEFGTGHEFLQTLGDVNLQFALSGPVSAKFGLFTDGFSHASRGVTVEKSTLADLEVDVFIAIDIPDAGAAAVRKVKGHRLLHLADAAVHSGGDAVLGAMEKLSGFGVAVSHWERLTVVIVILF